MCPCYPLPFPRELNSILRLGYLRHQYHHTKNSTAISTTTCWEQTQPRHILVINIIFSLSLLEISYHCYYHYSTANHARVRTIVHKKMLDIER